jgi:hypothetical protein
MAVLPTPGSPMSTGCSSSARQHLHDAADFLVATDDRISLLARQVREVPAVAFGAWYVPSGSGS